MFMQPYVSFLIASLVLIYSPGPVNVLTIGQSMQAGWRSALPCIWGATCALVLQLVLTALVLHSMLLVSEHSLAFMRWTGAGYLVYLGCKQWRSASLAEPNAAEHMQRGLFWRGFATSGLNPKSLLVFPSFIPQFISADAQWSAREQYLVLAATFTLLFVLGVISNALLSHRLGTLLRRPSRLKAFNRISSALLVGMGALMAAAH
ncbi:LysE family translocator [Paraburkholderia terrae]